MTQLTIRFRDPELERCVRNEAQRRDTSLNEAALALMRKGAGMPTSDERPLTVGNALDRFFGSWSAEEERVVLEAVAELDKADDTFSHTMESGAPRCSPATAISRASPDWR